ncbi:MAG: hypothetical protein M0Z51_12550, partial [Propionibacterium sp.]|nr:hypothetical protein [Propionibacterium sp.]
MRRRTPVGAGRWAFASRRAKSSTWPSPLIWPCLSTIIVISSPTCELFFNVLHAEPTARCSPTNGHCRR